MILLNVPAADLVISRKGSTSTSRRRRLAVLATLALAGAFAAASPSSAAAASCPASSPYSSLVAGTPGLLGYWRLGESSGSSACDVTGTNGGTYSGTVALGQAGALSGDANTAVRFSADGQVSVPHSAALDLNGAFTLETWVKPNTLPPSGFPGLLRKGSSGVQGASGGWLLWYARDTRALSFKRNGVEKVAPGWALSAPGTWSHVALTYDGPAQNALRFYLNGVLIDTQAGPPGGYPGLTSTDDLQLGRGDDTSSDHTLDDVAIYSSGLSSGTILQHYQTGFGSGSGAPPSGPTNLAGLASDGHVGLTWDASSSADVASYRVYRRNPDGTWPTGALAATPGPRQAYADASVANGTSYDYRVTAVSSAGAESTPSNEAVATPSESLPAGFSEVTLASGFASDGGRVGA